jgi:hypothetical protein
MTMRKTYQKPVMQKRDTLGRVSALGYKCVSLLLCDTVKAAEE